MGAFHIEGRLYLVPDETSWNLCELKKTPRTDSDWTNNITYHRTPEDALNFYIDKMRRKAAVEAGSGDLRDLLNILLAENERASSALKSVYEEVCTLRLKEPELSEKD